MKQGYEGGILLHSRFRSYLHQSTQKLKSLNVAGSITTENTNGMK